MQRIRRTRRRHGLPVNAEINITNLVDVAFVLLIIFMITAPILQGGIEVRLPEAQAAPLTAAEGVIVTVDSDGRVYLDQVALTLEEFPAQYRAYMSGGGQRSAFLKGDRDVPYGRIMEVLGIMEEAGVADVSLVFEPARRPGRR